MIKLAADEDFRNQILRGVRLVNPNVDILTVQDAGLAGAADGTVLEWAAAEGRVLLTHDADTMPGHAYDRIVRDLPVPGLFVLRQSLPIGEAVEQIILIAVCSLEGEWDAQVRYLPL